MILSIFFAPRLGGLRVPAHFHDRMAVWLHASASCVPWNASLEVQHGTPVAPSTSRRRSGNQPDLRVVIKSHTEGVVSV